MLSILKIDRAAPKLILLVLLVAKVTPLLGIFPMLTINLVPILK